MRLLHASGVVTGDSGPIVDGAVVVDERGQVLDLGPAVALLPRHAGLPIESIRGVLAPGLVNAHTHLELSALRGQVPGGGGFVPWVEQLIGARAELQPDEQTGVVESEVSQLDALGTVAVGEVTNSLSAVTTLAKYGFAGCIFHEVFGVELEALEKRVARLPRMVEEEVGVWPTSELVYAPTPHTLYTTHAAVARRLLEEARGRGVRASIHLAEHPAERRFLERGDGPVAEWYESRLKLPRDIFACPHKSPVDFADEIGALAPHVVCVHLTDARPHELEVVARRGASVVLCPRSNLYIETRLPPLLSLRQAGIALSLGTDSLASSPSLDVLAEARALADRFPTVPPGDLVRMATWEGARALGRADLGRIARGACPGLFAVDGDPGSDPCAFLLANLRAPRRWIARRPRPRS
jgi:cytosine/adenosine deaminase-related metal-dependent hydrolase